MTAHPWERGRPEGATATTMLEVVIPVYNEERDLAASVLGVRRYLATLPWTFRVTIADNASTDGTAVIARRLAHTYDDVRVVHLAEKGRGRALKRVWSGSDATVLVYMDVDLSTDLNALLPLVAPLISGHSDLAIGTRLGHGSRVERGPKRELISRCYNLILRGTLAAGFTDAQCGFKAIRRDVAQRCEERRVSGAGRDREPRCGKAVEQDHSRLIADVSPVIARSHRVRLRRPDDRLHDAAIQKAASAEGAGLLRRKGSSQ